MTAAQNYPYPDHHPVVHVESAAERRTLAHRAIIDSNANILGCIDQLEKNGELIRLDGGLHWAAASESDPDQLRPEAVAS